MDMHRRKESRCAVEQRVCAMVTKYLPAGYLEMACSAQMHSGRLPGHEIGPDGQCCSGLQGDAGGRAGLDVAGGPRGEVAFELEQLGIR